MRISVRSRPGKTGSEPCSFCLGHARLHVTGILERHELSGARQFHVRVGDGRRFVLRYTPCADRWELGAVYAPARNPDKEKLALLPRRALRYLQLASGSATRRHG